MSTINTVNGPIDVSEMGITLTHEHLWFDVSTLYKRAHEDLVMTDEEVTADNRQRILDGGLQTVVFKYADNLHFLSTDMIIKELEEYKAVGGRTIFDVSCVDLSRNPIQLQHIANKSGLNVVMGGSYYWFPSLPHQLKKNILEKGKNWLADIMIREFYEGAAGTGICPGVIGEVGNGDGEGTEIIYRASAIAQKETGAPMICHSPDIEVLDLFEQEGCDLGKVVMGHWSRIYPMKDAFKRGVFVSIDQFGMNFDGIEDDDSRVDAAVYAKEIGCWDRLLVSQDVCWKIRLKHYGGDGYAQIFHSVLPKMKAKGISEEEINTLLVDNPRRLCER